MSKLIVRGVESRDFDEWMPLWLGYNAFYGRTGKTALDEAVTRATWERFLDPHEPVHALVAQQDEQLVGLAHYLFHRSTTSVVDSCYLQDLFTKDSARGTGVGRKLIARVCDAARLAGSPRVYWLTHHENQRARQLYDELAENSGFLMYRKIL